MERIDHRYTFSAIVVRTVPGDPVETRSHMNAVLFAADDPALAEALKVYVQERIRRGIASRELDELKAMIRRVNARQGLKALRKGGKP